MVDLLSMVIQTPCNATIWVLTSETAKKVWKSQKWDLPLACTNYEKQWRGLRNLEA